MANQAAEYDLFFEELHLEFQLFLPESEQTCNPALLQTRLLKAVKFPREDEPSPTLWRLMTIDCRRLTSVL